MNWSPGKSLKPTRHARGLAPIRVVVGMVLVFFAFAVGGAEQELYTVTMPDGLPVTFVQPPAWHITTEVAGPSVTVELSPAGGGDFLMLVTIFPFPSNSPLSSPDGLRAAVLEAGNQKLAGALQDAIELTQVRGSGVTGYLYHLTDRNPESGPGDYREATQGIVLFAPYVATVTVLTHSEDDSTVERAMELLESFKVGSER